MKASLLLSLLVSTGLVGKGHSLSSPQRLNHPTNNNNNKKNKVRHYVFGYGSLICPDSRSKTNPTLADKEPLPVLIQDVERVWSARTSSGYTAMGVRFQEGAECTGILLEVSSEELDDLDRREANYHRRPIELENIEQVPFLDPLDFYDQDHPVFDAKEELEQQELEQQEEQARDDHNNNDTTESNDNNNNNDIKVWIYIQKDPILADPSHPIPQSYVDIIIRGCLTIGKEFAKSVIETTSGWNHEDDHWVNDRQVPIYKRADSEYSLEHQDSIDDILQDTKPQALEERVAYNPVEHLEALADALVKDMAHPRAIQHVVQRVKEVTDP